MTTDSQTPKAEPAEAAPQSSHRSDVDLMRLAACVTVMLGHAGGTLIRRTRDSEVESTATTIGHLAEAVNPWAVPLFFAIAGWAVLYGAPPKRERTMLRRITRHLVPLAVWTAIYLLAYNLMDTDAVDVRRQAIQSIFESDRPSYHLWYLYSYIPLITVFGALVLFWKGQRPWKLTAIGLFFASAGVMSQWGQKIFDLELGSWSWGFSTYGAAYFVFGGFLVHSARTFSVPRWLVILVFGAAACGVYYWETEIHYPIQNANPLTFILASCVVLMCGTITVSERTAQRLKKIASASFGAFLVHIFFIDFVFERLFPLNMGWAPTAALFAVSWVSIIVVSFTCSLAWGKLKLRRVLG